MISLVLCWLSLIVFLSFSQELTQLHYVFYSSCMLCVTSLYNSIYLVRISLKVIVAVFTIPNIIFWYIAFVYNDFLSLEPVKYEILTGLLFFYLCVLTYIVHRARASKNVPLK